MIGSEDEHLKTIATGAGERTGHSGVLPEADPISYGVVTPT